ncbi:MAG: lolD 1 [Gammaproteobacteria bacterium]|jgi:lipoprotein-releasing system ATP-binding protein|nr:lolD 1 [Gammaproteobacteria bacterium]
MSDYILECVALSKTYHDAYSKIEVLNHIDLQVKPGELIAIVGHSGSGKSTLLHLLGGLDKPSSGQVMLSGKNLSSVTEKEKCRLRNQYLGFVYQFHHLLPEFTALENVCMPLLIGHCPPKMAALKAEHLLDLVGLKKRLQHKIGELSGGERQRVAIARALVTYPACVLADEPTGNLDTKNADTVFKLFIELQKTLQTSVVMVTHDMQIASQADRILVLREGRLEAS